MWARGRARCRCEQGFSAQCGWQRRARGAPRRRHRRGARTSQGVRRRQRGRPPHAEPDGHVSGFCGGPPCPGGALATDQRAGAYRWNGPHSCWAPAHAELLALGVHTLSSHATDRLGDVWPCLSPSPGPANCGPDRVSSAVVGLRSVRLPAVDRSRLLSGGRRGMARCARPSRGRLARGCLGDRARGDSHRYGWRVAAPAAGQDHHLSGNK